MGNLDSQKLGGQFRLIFELLAGVVFRRRLH